MHYLNYAQQEKNAEQNMLTIAKQFVWKIYESSHCFDCTFISQ